MVPASECKIISVFRFMQRFVPMTGFVANLSAVLLSLCAAMAVLLAIFAAIGVPPLAALATMIDGACGSAEGWGYTLFYAADYLFAGLAVAIPYRAGLFNIGGEGQATIGGLAAASSASA